MTLLLLGLVLLAALAGAPLFVVLAAAAAVALLALELDLTVLAIELYRLAETPILLAIPLFALSGYLLAESQTPRRLVRLCDALLGWMPGGLAVIGLAICALFTAFTGASGLTIVAVGALLYPALRQAGYPDGFSLGLVTSTGSLGLLFAPSLPLILYAVLAQQLDLGAGLTIEDLFLAGLLPGLTMVLVLAAWAAWVAWRHGVPRRAFSAAELGAALRENLWELPLPVVVLGGIYGGWFAVSEAAAVTALYVLLVTLGIRREIGLARLPAVLREAMMLVGGILLILGVALALASAMVFADIPARLLELAQAHIDSRWLFLLVLTLLLLALGMLLDVFSAIVIMVPLLLPLAVSYGIHPAHLGILLLANLQLGYLTPPVGMNLFIASQRFAVPITTLLRTVLPFFVLLLCCVLLITFWPGLSLALLR